MKLCGIKQQIRLHITPKLMEKQNESIENSKYTSESFAKEFQKIGINIFLLLNSHTMDDPIQSQNKPNSTSCLDVNPLEFHQHSQK